MADNYLEKKYEEMANQYGLEVEKIKEFTGEDQAGINKKDLATEKALNLMAGTPAQKHKDGNKIEFLVHRDADKALIKAVFEERFEVKVDKVWTKIQKDGKHAIIKLSEGYSAEDVGMRVGVF